MKQEKEICLNQLNTINPMERLIAAASYLTAGMAGFLWLILAAFLKKRVKNFLLFHIMQAIFLSIGYFLIIELYKLVFVIIVKIPLINSIFIFMNGVIFNPLPLFWGMSLMQVCTSALILYLAVTSFMGLYSYIPCVSDIIKRNLGIR